jgi:hypothetical protein
MLRCTLPTECESLSKIWKPFKAVNLEKIEKLQDQKARNDIQICKFIKSRQKMGYEPLAEV